MAYPRAWLVVAVTAVMAVAISGAADKTMEEKCGPDIQKLAVCLSYATGKAATPSKDCCESVKGIKESEPQCLCFILQQTRGGNERIKSMGIQEAKLFQLPSACVLKNASLADCPKLLGLAPNSPDAAIFASNATAVPGAPAASAGTGATTTQPLSSTDDHKGGSTKLVGFHHVALLVTAVAVFFAGAIH